MFTFKLLAQFPRAPPFDSQSPLPGEVFLFADIQHKQQVLLSFHPAWTIRFVYSHRSLFNVASFCDLYIVKRFVMYRFTSIRIC